MKKEAKNLELLSPAGGMTQLVAAVENGADAVYIGGKFLNARNRADNFSGKEMKEAIDYAHIKNTKVYVAMNTLVAPDELTAGLNAAADACELGADALIIQDLGFGARLAEQMPGIPLHLSTQATVYNPSGLEASARLGYARVIPARELSLAEIQAVCKAARKTNQEVEVFVHGALCVCYSGLCQMSRVIGGRSANRGECAQPCRLPYTDEDGRHKAYYMSPRDLCLLADLPDLAEAGVTSFKIEGRMKNADYVATVSRIYRKYIDKYLASGGYTIEDSDMEELKQIYSRGGFTRGFYGKVQSKTAPEDFRKYFLSGDLPKHQGRYIGKVVDIPKARDLIDVKLEAPLNMGDGIEVRAEELTGNTITYIKPVGEGILRIGDIRGSVKIGDEIYKTGDAVLNQKAQDSYKNKDGKLIKIDMDFKASLADGIRLTMREDPAPPYRDEPLEITYNMKKGVEKARKKVITPEMVEEQLRKTGGTAFTLRDITIEIEDGTTMSLSTVNKARREAITAFESMKIVRREDVSLSELPTYEISTDNNARLAGVDLPENILTIPSITKGKTDEDLRSKFDRISNGEDPKEVFNLKGDSLEVLINNLGWIREFKDAGFTVYGGPGLNIFNGASAEVFQKMGVIPAYASYELMARPPLMVMEYDFPLSTFLDRKGERYWAAHDNSKTTIEK